MQYISDVATDIQRAAKAVEDSDALSNIKNHLTGKKAVDLDMAMNNLPRAKRKLKEAIDDVKSLKRKVRPLSAQHKAYYKNALQEKIKDDLAIIKKVIDQIKSIEKQWNTLEKQISDDKKYAYFGFELPEEKAPAQATIKEQIPHPTSLYELKDVYEDLVKEISAFPEVVKPVKKTDEKEEEKPAQDVKKPVEQPVDKPKQIDETKEKLQAQIAPKGLEKVDPEVIGLMEPIFQNVQRAAHGVVQIQKMNEGELVKSTIPRAVLQNLEDVRTDIAALKNKLDTLNEQEQLAYAQLLVQNMEKDLTPIMTFARPIIEKIQELQQPGKQVTDPTINVQIAGALVGLYEDIQKLVGQPNQE